jgi:hypothetical protein
LRDRSPTTRKFAFGLPQLVSRSIALVAERETTAFPPVFGIAIALIENHDQQMPGDCG